MSLNHYTAFFEIQLYYQCDLRRLFGVVK